ncbi:glycosyl transferase [Streptomyces sp. NPDC127066]|uniref:glycosyl transferase n=1 Tax=Streptomyces sp. NPDC127066 TaxID=3347125 RepID=UPI0036471E3C
MVDLLFEGPYDQVVGARRESVDTAYRPGHAAGTKMLTGAVRFLFGNDVSDMLSGYRVFSRRYIKSFPALSREFETETEMTVHALSLRLPTAELEVGFKDRPAGSVSKLRTYRDGWRILKLILGLARRQRPCQFHAVIADVFTIVALALGLPVVVEFAHTGTVPRLPTAVLASAIMIIAVLVLLVSYILESFKHMRQEQASLAHLGYSAPSRGAELAPVSLVNTASDRAPRP